MDVTNSGAGLLGCTLTGTPLEIVEVCGHGGSAEVYRAVDTRTGRSSAVKVLHGRAASKTVNNEARVMSSVDSPRVVSLHSTGRLLDGRAWLAMEYLPARSLLEVVEQRGPIAPSRVARWLQHASRGLGELHAAGWVHRDVKPSNLVLVDEGTDRERVVIIDFGISERIGARPQDLSGTPDYIAPEQAQREAVDLRSDIYSLGCCTYELLTGRRPVSSSGVQAKLDTHVEGVRLAWPDAESVPSSLRRLVERCVRFSPADRPQRMAELEAVLRRSYVAKPPPKLRSAAWSSSSHHERPATLVGHPGVASTDAPTLDARSSGRHRGQRRGGGFRAGGGGSLRRCPVRGDGRGGAAVRAVGRSARRR